MNADRPDLGPPRLAHATRQMHRAVLPVYESASIMWTFAESGQRVEDTGVALPVGIGSGGISLAQIAKLRYVSLRV
jgi:hypothetical protein